jgi:uncharacterized membrane protein YfcA
LSVRRIFAVLIFCSAVYFSVQAGNIFKHGADASSRLVALIYVGFAVCGSLVALVLLFGKSRDRYKNVRLGRVENDSALEGFKAFVARLTAGVLGISCLHMCVSGIFTGSLPNIIRRRTDILFAHSPYSFTVMLMFWLALGGLMTWLAFSSKKKQDQGSK